MKAHRIAIGILVLILPFLETFAQEKLIVPRATENAYKNETRQKDGNPGKNYWQNSADYNIDVVMDVENMVLKGEEEITYYNNSPDSW